MKNSHARSLWTWSGHKQPSRFRVMSGVEAVWSSRAMFLMGHQSSTAALLPGGV